MNIGIDFTHDFGYSGIGTYSRSLTEAMTKIEPGNLYNILTLRRKIQKVKTHFTQNRSLAFLDPFPNPMMLGTSLKSFIQGTHKNIWKKQAHLYDIVHFTHQDFFVPGIPNAAVTIHDIIPLYDKTFSVVDKNTPSYLKTAETIRHARTIFVPSKFVYNELQNHFPFCENKIRVTYEGVKSVFREMPADSDILNKYGLHASSSFFLYVGRYEARKNLDNLLVAYSYLPDSLKKEIKLVLICPAKSAVTKEILKKKIFELGLEQNVLHLPDVTDEDLVHFYNAALALLFVSFSEGFGLPLVEAMNCGCPAVIANCSSLPEISGSSSILIDPFDPESIRYGMLKIIDDSQLRKSLTEKCLLRAKNFSWKNTANETLNEFNLICS